MKKNISIAVLCCLPILTSAHVVFDNSAAPAGSYYRGALRVSHGCSGSPVRQLILSVPDGVQGAKPMPKPGWDIEIRRRTLAQPYVSHGRTVTEEVSEIIWTARTPQDYLKNEYFDEFGVLAKLPATPGRLYWKSTQLCEQGQITWDEVPQAGSGKSLTSPAAMLDVVPLPASAAAHEHHKH